MLQAEGQKVHVTSPKDRRCAGVVVHRAPLEGERLRRLGIVVTTPARTLVDLADVVPRRTLERAFDEAEYLRLDWTAAAPRHGRSGSGILASVLALHEPGTTRTLSTLEELFLASCDQRGFRRPEVNARIEGYLCDFVWHAEGVIVETDGERAHGTRRARERDPIRDAELQLAGWIVIRVTYARLLNEPNAAAAQIREALRRGPAAPGGPRRS
jgi:very-short-patch-repair endonuclease